MLRLVRAWQISTAGAAFPASVMVDMEPDTAYEHLDAIAAELASAGVAVESEVYHGVASQVLLDESDDAELLVMGMRGLGGFKRLVLGSVSHQCATHARAPVVVVPHDARTDGRLERVVVGMDGSPGAIAALTWAMDFAPEDVPVWAVGAWQPRGWTGRDPDVVEHEARHERDRFERGVHDAVKASGRDRTIERQFVDGRPATVLVDAGSSADLLVVGERGHRGMSGLLLGSVATEVLHRAPCAVAVVPVPATSDDG